MLGKRDSLSWKGIGKDSGVAGTQVFISVISLLFIFGLIVMIGSLIGTEFNIGPLATEGNLSTEPTVTEIALNLTGSLTESFDSWFPIIIVIVAMVVLIVLVSIIITAIKGSKLMNNEIEIDDDECYDEPKEEERTTIKVEEYQPVDDYEEGEIMEKLKKSIEDE